MPNSRKPGTRRLTVAMPPDLRERVEARAQQDNTTPSGVTRAALEDYTKDAE